MKRPGISHFRPAAVGFSLIATALTLSACAPGFGARIDEDWSQVQAARIKVASDRASGDTAALAVDGKALYWAQAKYDYDKNGSWEPLGERDGHGKGWGSPGRNP